MMNPTTPQGSAKIYQFPAGGRSALKGPPLEEIRSELAAPSVNLADCSGSWYHAAAIAEADAERNH
nr:DUF2735 domain-containing protein [Bradyrhizobium sp.]